MNGKETSLFIYAQGLLEGTATFRYADFGVDETQIKMKVG